MGNVKKSKSKNPNAMHRQRMRNRFLKNGLDAFEPHEILELLLFYALPRVNTNQIAHRLIEKFHSLSGVFDADIEELKQVNGIQENAAMFLKMMPQVFNMYQKDKATDRQVLKSVKQICTYVLEHFEDITQEKLILVCLDEHLQLLECLTLSITFYEDTPVNLYQVMECIFRCRSTRVLVIRKYKISYEIEIDQDAVISKYLGRFFDSVGIHMIDYVALDCRGHMNSTAIFRI